MMRDFSRQYMAKASGSPNLGLYLNWQLFPQINGLKIKLNSSIGSLILLALEGGYFANCAYEARFNFAIHKFSCVTAISKLSVICTLWLIGVVIIIARFGDWVMNGSFFWNSYQVFFTLSTIFLESKSDYRFISKVQSKQQSMQLLQLRGVTTGVMRDFTHRSSWNIQFVTNVISLFQFGVVVVFGVCFVFGFFLSLLVDSSFFFLSVCFVTTVFLHHK